MSLGRAVACIVLPPLAVLDKGCGAVILVTLFTMAGWLPGVLAAFTIGFARSGSALRTLGPNDPMLVACPKGHVTSAYYRRCPMCGRRLPRV